MKQTQLLLIIGRTASGKDTLAQALIPDGLSMVLSYTTRPKRPGEDDTHIFITEDEANTFTNRLAETFINGYQYFVTPECLHNSDIYIVDPKGFIDLTQNEQFQRPYSTIYLDVDENIRCKRYMERANTTSEAFQQRNMSEKTQFDMFEQSLKLEFFNYDSTILHMKNCTIEQAKQIALNHFTNNEYSDKKTYVF